MTNSVVSSDQQARHDVQQLIREVNLGTAPPAHHHHGLPVEFQDLSGSLEQTRVGSAADAIAQAGSALPNTSAKATEMTAIENLVANSPANTIIFGEATCAADGHDTVKDQCILELPADGQALVYPVTPGTTIGPPHAAKAGLLGSIKYVAKKIFPSSAPPAARTNTVEFVEKAPPGQRTEPVQVQQPKTEPAKEPVKTFGTHNPPRPIFAKDDNPQDNRETNQLPTGGPPAPNLTIRTIEQSPPPVPPPPPPPPVKKPTTPKTTPKNPPVPPPVKNPATPKTTPKNPPAPAPIPSPPPLPPVKEIKVTVPPRETKVVVENTGQTAATADVLLGQTSSESAAKQPSQIPTLIAQNPLTKTEPVTTTAPQAVITPSEVKVPVPPGGKAEIIVAEPKTEPVKGDPRYALLAQLAGQPVGVKDNIDYGEVTLAYPDNFTLNKNLAVEHGIPFELRSSTEPISFIEVDLNIAGIGTKLAVGKHRYQIAKNQKVFKGFARFPAKEGREVELSSKAVGVRLNFTYGLYASATERNNSGSQELSTRVILLAPPTQKIR